MSFADYTPMPSLALYLIIVGAFSGYAVTLGAVVIGFIDAEPTPYVFTVGVLFVWLAYQHTLGDLSSEAMRDWESIIMEDVE